MNYQTFIPNRHLSKYIKCYWSLENSSKHALLSKERIFPDGCLELIFHYGDLFKNYNAERTYELMPRSFIYGQFKGFIDIEATGSMGIFSIRFQPNGLKPFIDCDTNAVTGKILSVFDCWGKDGDVLEDKILNALSNKHRIVILESFLLNKLKKHHEVDAVVEHCVNLIVKNEGNINIDKLAAHLNIGRRHLERKFMSTVGISPKMFCRITRFQHTLSLIVNGQFKNFTAIAHGSGFYDQAHFIKDFGEFTGLNPSQFIAEKFPLVKYFCQE